MSLDESFKECWECDFSEYPIKASERIGLHEILPNGLTPYELMYGVKDSDSRYSTNLENLHSLI